ncbi:MAG: HAAS signaling domain-containing protein [Thermoguttaceae bacterium]
MESQPWLNRVRERLVRQLLPPSYVQRFVEELSDHLEDVKEDGMDQNSFSRLGDPEQVADTAVAAYRRRSFLGRHPVAAFLVFGISPVVSLVVLVVMSVRAFAYLAGFAVGIGIVKQPDHFGVVGSAVVCLAGSLLTIVIPSILASIAYCRLTTRLGVSRKWILVSCVTLAVLASSTSFWRAGSGNHPWHFAACWSWLWLGGGWVALTEHLVNLSVPLAIGWWFLRRKHDQGQLQLAS